MKKLLSYLLIAFYSTSLAFADGDPGLNIAEEDGSPSLYPYQLKVTDGTLTDNGDGTASLQTGGGGGGGDITAVGNILSGAAAQSSATNIIVGNITAVDGTFTNIGRLVPGFATFTDIQGIIGNKVPADATFSRINSTIIGNAVARDASFTMVGVSGLTTGRCVQTGANGVLTVAADVCNASGGGGTITQVGNITTGVSGTSSANHVTFGNLQATQIGNVSVGDASFAGLVADTTTLYVNPITHRVGIGTSSPSRSLHVVGNGIISERADATPQLVVTNPSGTFGTSTWRFDVDSQFNFFRFSDSVNGGVPFQAADGSYARALLVDTTGFVGIGSENPDRILDIVDSTNPQLRLTQTDATTYTDFQTTSSGDMIMNVDGITNQLVLDNGGNVGIGTNSPNHKLHVAGNMTADDATFATISSTNATFLGIGRTVRGDATFSGLNVGADVAPSKITIRSDTNAEAIRMAYSGGGTIYHTLTTGYSISPESDFIAFNMNTGVANTTTEAIRFNGRGRVGIGGVALPSKSLEVSGDAMATGMIATNATFTNIGRTTPGFATFTDIQGIIGNKVPADATFTQIRTAGYTQALQGSYVSANAAEGMNATSNNLQFRSNGTDQRMTIYSNGRVGINTSSVPSQQFAVAGTMTAGNSTFLSINSSVIGNSTPADASFTAVSVSNLTNGQCVQYTNGKLAPSGGSCGGVASGDATFTTVQSPKIGNIAPGDATFNTVTVLSGGLSTGDATFATITASAATFTGFVKIPKQELFNLADFTLTSTTSIAFPWTNSPIQLTAGKKYKMRGVVYLSSADSGDGVAGSIDGTFTSSSAVYHWTVIGDGSPGVMENSTTGTSFSETTMTATGVLYLDFFVNCNASGTFQTNLSAPGGSTIAEEGSYLVIYEYN